MTNMKQTKDIIKRNKLFAIKGQQLTTRVLCQAG